jgi:hypothetical protein
MIRVVVLGCGPAGLLAAHAASLHGCDVHILSLKQPSFINGAQFLHEGIPGVTKEPDGHVLFTKTGSRDGYARKVYGSAKMPVSWDLWENAVSRPAWSMQKSYSLLWKMYVRGIKHFPVNSIEDIEAAEQIGADLYITSLPATSMCYNNEHIFESVPMYVSRRFDAPIPENTIIYNGHVDVPWHRASSLFGHRSMEFSRRPMGVNALVGTKPTAHNCDCNPHWMRVGRFGRWKRGVLVHHAFNEVTRALQQVQGTFETCCVNRHRWHDGRLPQALHPICPRIHGTEPGHD